MNLREREREYYGEGEYLGIGFDSFQEKFLSTAINCENIKEEDLRKRAIELSSEIQYSFEHIQSKSDLCKSFSLSGSISGALSTGTVGMLAGHARGQYFSNKNTKFENLCILLNYQLKNQAYRIKNPELSTNAKNFLESYGSTEFRKKFGDEFIIGFRTGAEYTALIEVLSVEKEEQEKKYLDIKTTISNIFYQVDLTSQINNEDRKKLQEFNANISCFKKGSTISDNSMILTFEQMIYDFKEFQRNVKATGGVEYTTIFADYDQLLDIKHNIITPDLSELKHNINQLKFQRIKYQEELLDIENKLKFKEAEHIALFEEIKKIKDKIYKIDSYIRQCYQIPDFIKPQVLRRYLQGYIPDES
jgi:hypothetical protein